MRVRETGSLCFVAAAFAAALSGGLASAAVYTDQPLGTTINTNVAGATYVVNGTTTGAGFANAATLNARGDMKVIQDWTGIAAYGWATNVSHILAFTDPSLPDIRITNVNNSPSSLGSSASAAGTESNGFAGGGFDGATDTRLLHTNYGSADHLIIEFGSYVGSAFTPGAIMPTAAGFDLVGGPSWAVPHTQNVTFKDSGLAVLSSQSGTQTVAGDSATSASNFFFGHQAAVGIQQIDIAYTGAAGWYKAGIDNLAFATVPEPASLGLLGAASLMMLRRRKA